MQDVGFGKVPTVKGRVYYVLAYSLKILVDRLQHAFFLWRDVAPGDD